MISERRDKQLDTAGAERLDLRAGAATIAALRSGPSDGSPVLLLPGYTGSKEDFGPLLAPLATAGFRAVAVDLPGQYESPGPHDAHDYTPDALAESVLALAADLGPDVRLLGHSFGGLVARAAVIADPSAFDSLVLMSSGPAAIGGARQRRIEALEPVLRAHGLDAVYAAMQAADGEDASLPPALAAFMRTRFLAGSPIMLQGMGNALRTEPDRIAELAGTGLPVLVLHGADDDAWPPAVQHEMAERLGARYAVIDGAAHSPAVENPVGTIAALLEFWRR